VPPVYTIDEPLVEVVLGKIWERYCSGAYPYNLAADSLPQNYLPESLPRGGIEEAYYWVIVCLWMRTTNTTTAAKQVAKLYDHLAKKTCLNPFNPFNAAQMKPPRIATLMKEVGLGLDDSSPEWWVENARRVVERWDGDVRRPFMGATSYDEVWPRLINAKDEQQGGLLGFQHKMTCMLLYFLSEHGLSPFHLQSTSSSCVSLPRPNWFGATTAVRSLLGRPASSRRSRSSYDWPTLAMSSSTALRATASPMPSGSTPDTSAVTILAMLVGLPSSTTRVARGGNAKLPHT
jgi:hypothetical protein